MNSRNLMVGLVTLATLMPLGSPQQAQAATIAVVDSGTDFEHAWLAGRQYINAKEIAGNRVDDDRNGKVDDIVGWNFVDRYGQVFFRDHLETYSPVVYRLMEIVARKQSGKSTARDQAYWDKHVTGLSADKRNLLIAHLNSFGQYTHGTHVAGIVTQHASDSQILSARVFADDPPPDYIAPTDFLGTLAKDKQKGSWTSLVYKFMAALNAGLFDQVSEYLKERRVDVANYSLGVPLQTIARGLLAAKGISDPTPEQLSEETLRAYAKFEPYGKKWMSRASQTLFVVAAGNDGTDNDRFPTFPANIDMPNSITVAASLDYAGIADFSCYGAKSVHIAAPGVAIESSVPSLNNRTLLPMSGTSMAAPLVAGIAGRIKDLNPKLSASEVKAILMGTVDKKPWLKGKVISEGVVNPDRAYLAARLSASTSITAAIASAREDVRDVMPDFVASPSEGRLKSATDNGLSEFARALVF